MDKKTQQQLDAITQRMAELKRAKDYWTSGKQQEYERLQEERNALIQMAQFGNVVYA